MKGPFHREQWMYQLAGMLKAVARAACRNMNKVQASAGAMCRCVLRARDRTFPKITAQLQLCG